MRRKSSVFQPQLVKILRKGSAALRVIFILSIAMLYYNAQNLAGRSIIFLLFKQTYYKSVLVILRRIVLCGTAFLQVFLHLKYFISPNKPGFTAYYSCRLISGQWPFIPFVT